MLDNRKAIVPMIEELHLGDRQFKTSFLRTVTYIFNVVMEHPAKQSNINSCEIKNFERVFVSACSKKTSLEDCSA